MNRYSRLFTQVDAASFSVFRIGFGAIMVWEVYRYFSHGWIDRYFIEPLFHFKYFGVGWVQAWPGDGMYVHFLLLGVVAFLVTIGFLYRFAIIAFTLGFIYIFLLDQTQYLNHFYFVILISVLLCFVPANRIWSVDAHLNSGRSRDVPLWSIWILRTQIEIMLLYAGFAKLNADWLNGVPLARWLADRSDFPLIGHLFHEPWVAMVAVYGVIVLHIVGAPLLLFRKTRLVVLVIYGVFHLMNHLLFNIGIFPWITLFGSLIFFDPDWPRQIHAWLSKILKLKQPHAALANTPAICGVVPPKRHQTIVLTLAAVWFAVQLLLPLRHYLYPGNVAWTEEGHRFSWRMKLNSRSGESRFDVRDVDTGRIWRVHPQQFLNRRQYRKMSTRPDMVLQFAHFLAGVWRDEHRIRNVEVYAMVYKSLNYRQSAFLVDPKRNLADVERSLIAADWILPLSENRQFAIREPR